MVAVEKRKILTKGVVDVAQFEVLDRGAETSTICPMAAQAALESGFEDGG